MKRSIMLLLIFVLMATYFFTAQSAFASSANTWTEKAPMQVARSGLGVAVVDGKIYAIGGTTYTKPSTGGVVGTNEMYDPETDTWVFKASMPTPRAEFAIAVFENKIYCIGGSGGVNEVYDPITDTWENKTAMPTARWALQANVVSGKIYLIGGYNFDDSAFGGSITSINEVYDPKTDSWASAIPIPIGTSDYTSVVVDNKIYIIGGLSSSPKSNLNQIFNPLTDSWSQGAQSPSGIRYGAAGVSEGVNALKRVYVFGPTWTLWEGEPTITVRVYNPATNHWAAGVNMLTNRSNFGVAVVRDLLYVIGGYTPNRSTTFNQNGHSITQHATNEQYLPLGYGKPDPSYDGTPPKIDVLSPLQGTYSTTNIMLDFTVNASVSSMSYVLDGAPAVIIAGNTTLYGLSYGSHNLTVYATDVAGKIGASEVTFFVVAESASNQVDISSQLVIGVLIILAVAVAFVGLILSLKKRKRLSAVGKMG